MSLHLLAQVDGLNLKHHRIPKTIFGISTGAFAKKRKRGLFDSKAAIFLLLYFSCPKSLFLSSFPLERFLSSQLFSLDVEA